MGLGKSLALRDVADLTPYFLASHEQDATAPLDILFLASSVIITA